LTGSAIGQLSQLQTLDLSRNQLTQIPDSIGQLSQLQTLDLGGNQLGQLPDSIRRIHSLRALYLHGNDKLGLSPTVLGPTREEQMRRRETQPIDPRVILDYYFRLRGARRPLNEAKLILVGRGGVGKTSLVNRLTAGKFSSKERKTDGIRITQWPLRLNGKEDVKLNIWDFGGQEIMHATHQFFLTESSLYLLVLNGREGGEDADAEYWLKLIESFGCGSPVIVVLNKVEEHPFDVNRRALQQKYPAIREFIRADCKAKIGLDDLRKTIEREADRLEHLRDAFPGSWFKIKDELSGMKRNFLSFEEYRKVCAKLGEADDTAQNDLAAHLHNLGIALNYKDDPRLQDTHVLNPQWVTNGIYKVLNSDKLEKQQGAIHLRDLSEPVNGMRHSRFRNYCTKSSLG
jgi:internalin A